MKQDYNPLLCMSIKSRGSNIQCTHFRKDGLEYCGIHLKSKKIVRIDMIDDDEYCGKKTKLEIKFVDNKIKKYLSYEDDIGSILKIQKTFRMWNIFRRNSSNNKEDCGTLDSIYSIPIEYYFDYLDSDGFKYAFDLRTLDLISINPYNQKKFPSDEKFKNRLESKIQYIKKTERKMKYDSPKLTEEQKYAQFLIRVFQKFDMIGQYTDTTWFDNLSFEDLKKFYRNAYDMFDYRAQLTDDVKKKIVKDGNIFNKLIHNINLFKYKHKRILEFEILKEMEKIVDEGEDKEYKILGVNLILSALVEVSPNAALALPHLVQSTFF